MRLFDKKDKKNITATFITAALLFLGLFIAVEGFGPGIEEIIGLIGEQSSDAVNHIGEAAEDFDGFQEKKLSSPSGKNDEEKYHYIEMDISADEIIITQTDEDFFMTTLSDYSSSETFESVESNGHIKITTKRHLPATFTLSIPKKVLQKNTIKVDIEAKCDIITVKGLSDAGDDSISVEADRGIISVSEINCKNISLSSETDPVVVSGSSAEVMECESEEAGVYVDGIFEELKVSGRDNVVCALDSSVNRLDAQSSGADVNISFFGSSVTGYTARLDDCGNNFSDTYGCRLLESSRKGNLIYKYGDGSIKINITDTHGNISITQYGDQQ